MSNEASSALGTLGEWPYPIRYGEESEVSTDVLVLGGGIAGCWAAISAARKGLKVAIVEKAATIRSGAGGAGCDHWNYTVNPLSTITAEEMVKAQLAEAQSYTNAISSYIASQEAYDTLLELEQMGGKVRDTGDEFKGAPFRDEKTKFCFAFDYANKIYFRVWGTTFKPALYQECLRLGVQIYDRTQATSLLTERGQQGSRVVGATAINVRTGEFTVFKARATVMCLCRPQRIWYFSTEFSGLCSLKPHTGIGNGHAMAWRAGAELTMMEKSRTKPDGIAPGYPQFGQGSPYTTWYPCSIIDAHGKEIPWVDRDGTILKSIAQRTMPAPGQQFMGERNVLPPYAKPRLIPDLYERIKAGEFTLPLYADLPGMPEMERRVIWGLMVGEEGKTKIPVLQTYNNAGFDPNKDLLQNYQTGIPGVLQSGQAYRLFGESGDAGGPVIDWNLQTSLEGLYAAGDYIFGGNYHHHAAATGRYAGRKAAGYALSAAEPVVEREQIKKEKKRVYVPASREEGVEWKELNNGVCQIMQNYCGNERNEEMFNIGLAALNEMKSFAESEAYASDPHKLGRLIDVFDIITVSQSIIHACIARKASSQALNFYRFDYPEIDPPAWRKFITIKQDGDKVVIGELPIDYGSPLRESYEASNKDYEAYVR